MNTVLHCETRHITYKILIENIFLRSLDVKYLSITTCGGISHSVVQTVIEVLDLYWPMKKMTGVTK